MYSARDPYKQNSRTPTGGQQMALLNPSTFSEKCVQLLPQKVTKILEFGHLAERWCCHIPQSLEKRNFFTCPNTNCLFCKERLFSHFCDLEHVSNMDVKRSFLSTGWILAHSSSVMIIYPLWYIENQECVNLIPPKLIHKGEKFYYEPMFV